MEWRDLLGESYARVQGFLEHVLDGLALEDIDWQPASDSNSIGWLVWHLTRQQDVQMAALMGEEPLWSSDGWDHRFEMTTVADDFGFGYAPEDVASFKSPESTVLLGYHRAVLARTRRYVSTLSPADLDRELDEPWFQPLPTVGVRLVSIMQDSMLHAGQAAYVRGLRQGRGWQSY